MTITIDQPKNTERLAALTKERLNDLTARRAAIPPLGSRPLSMSRDESDALDAQAVTLDRRIAAIHAATAAVATLGSAEADATWRDRLTAWRTTLGTELLAIKSPIRDKLTMGRSINLTLSLKCVDFGLRVLTDSGYDLTTLRLGELLRASGYEPVGADPDRNFSGTMPWYGGLIETEKRIATLAQRREQAQAQLDDALMDDAERATRDAESKARRDALNALPTRKTRGDGSQYDRYPDGRRVEVAG